MADHTVTRLPETGDRFRRDELSWQLRRLADLYVMTAPLHVGTVAPVLEFQVLMASDVDRIAVEIGRAPTRFKSAYFVELNGDELRVRWSTTLPDDDASGLTYTRTDSDPDDPTPVSPARVPPHTGSIVADGVLADDPEPFVRDPGTDAVLAQITGKAAQ